MPETRTYWLSFCDPDRPTGAQFLGACVELTDRWYAPPAGTSRRVALTDLPRHQLLTSAELQICGAPYA